jgi:hypothetical protein
VSYGREPFYVYACACGGEPDETKDPPHPKEPHVMFGCCTYPVQWDELAQFIASVHWRGELPELLDRGYALRPDLRRRIDLANPAPLSKPSPVVGAELGQWRGPRTPR